ncbi:MAG: putative porin [Flavobacteriaceae bacterium]|nr:putative porin [Flavobacteriaceae bacterium]
MNRFLLLLIFICSVGTSFAQIRPVQVDQQTRDTTTQRGSQRSTSNRFLKNRLINVEEYKIISRENDTTYLDTTLSIAKDYKFNYLRRDRFDLIPFSNTGQTHNALSHDFRTKNLMPLFGARARHYNYMEIDDINYYHVPTPLTELMFKTVFEQGQLLDAFFTANTSRQFNFSVAYKGLRSLGKYQHILTSTGNFRVTANYKTKNQRYRARAHIATQDLLNQENGGLQDKDLVEFESGNPEFLDRGVFDPVFENAESILEGKRFHLEQDYALIRQKDSVKFNELRIGNVISFTNKYYEYRQSQANEVFGQAFENAINERTTLEDFYVEVNSKFENKTLGTLGARIGYNNFNYGYDKLVFLNGQRIGNRIKGDAISAGGSYEKQLGGLLVKGNAGLMVSGDLTGNFLDAGLEYKLNDDLIAGGGININSRKPNYNHLLYQSDYVNYNWENDFDNVKTKQLSLYLHSKKWADVEVDINTIDDYTYFSKNAEGFVRPFQSPKTINYLRLRLSREISWGKFHLMNTIRYQNVAKGEELLQVPEIITRNTLYFADNFFENNALYLQTGINFTYFTSFNMNAYDPLLSEFYVQSATSLGGFPMFDFFINAKVRQTRIFLKAEHINSAWTGYNYFSAPNYPYRDFTVRFGLVWNFFL